jgi:hypothetical protein
MTAAVHNYLTTAHGFLQMPFQRVVDDALKRSQSMHARTSEVTGKQETGFLVEVESNYYCSY